jgi:hypothetical protein
LKQCSRIVRQSDNLVCALEKLADSRLAPNNHYGVVIDV